LIIEIYLLLCMLLELKTVTAGYGDFKVLKGVSLIVGHGEIVCLIGPNGAGKSTVLKSIVGLALKTSGDIIWNSSSSLSSEDNGIVITDFPTHELLKEGIGFVPQGRLVFPSMTVRENLEMGGYLMNRRATLERNLDSVFSQFPILRERARERASSLSGGEQQMLAIGRALMMTPKLLMLDEPSLGLSPIITEELFEKLKDINRAGTTLLVVEQNVRLILKYAARGYLMAGGEVKFSGTSAELGDEKRMREAYLM
jgi:branched-chain amino acid transport system ATP-binding protein